MFLEECEFFSFYEEAFCVFFLHLATTVVLIWLLTTMLIYFPPFLLISLYLLIRWLMVSPNISQRGLNGSSIRLVSWNVRRLGGPIKRSKVFSHLKGLNTDIAFLQETHLRINDHYRMLKAWVGQIFHSSFNSKYKGAAILDHQGRRIYLQRWDTGADDVVCRKQFATFATVQTIEIGQ